MTPLGRLFFCAALSFVLPPISGAERANGRLVEQAAPDWRPVSDVGEPSGRIGHTAMWTGTEMIIWGGTSYEAGEQRERVHTDGGRYNPAADRWSSLSPVGTPSPRVQHVAVWTGFEMIVWGGRDGATYMDTCARYDPAT